MEEKKLRRRAGVFVPCNPKPSIASIAISSIPKHQYISTLCIPSYIPLTSSPRTALRPVPKAKAGNSKTSKPKKGDDDDDESDEADGPEAGKPKAKAKARGKPKAAPKRKVAK